MKIRPILLIILFGIFGCVPGSVLLRNDAGETVKCEGSAESVDACIKKAEAANFKRVEEQQMAPLGRSGY